MLHKGFWKATFEDLEPEHLVFNCTRANEAVHNHLSTDRKLQGTRWPSLLLSTIVTTHPSINHGPMGHPASCFCPMRWTLSIAWASADGFQAGSTNITRLAPVTVSPVPPTCMLKPGWSWQIHTGQVQRKGSCNASGFTSPQHKAKYLESSCWNFCNFKSRSCGGRGATL